MNDSIIQLFEQAKKDKKAFLKIKDCAIRVQNFQVAADLRDMEKELFPDTPEVKAAKKLAHDVSLAFRMVEVNAPNDSLCWIIHQTLELHKKKKGKFDLKDAANLIARRNELFADEEPKG